MRALVCCFFSDHSLTMPAQAVHDAATNVALHLSYLPLSSLLPTAELETGTRRCSCMIVLHVQPQRHSSIHAVFYAVMTVYLRAGRYRTTRLAVLWLQGTELSPAESVGLPSKSSQQVLTEALAEEQEAALLYVEI